MPDTRVDTTGHLQTSRTASEGGGTRRLSQTPKGASPFGLKVARILDDIWALYNLSAKVDFSAEDAIQFRLHKSIATYDFDELTQLVVRCHDACVRLSIRGSGSNLSLHFSPRERDTDSMVTRHPTMEQAIERVRARTYFGCHAPPPPAAASDPHVADPGTLSTRDEPTFPVELSATSPPVWKP